MGEGEKGRRGGKGEKEGERGEGEGWDWICILSYLTASQAFSTLFPVTPYINVSIITSPPSLYPFSSVLPSFHLLFSPSLPPIPEDASPTRPNDYQCPQTAACSPSSPAHLPSPWRSCESEGECEREREARGGDRGEEDRGVNICILPVWHIP